MVPFRLNLAPCVATCRRGIRSAICRPTYILRFEATESYSPPPFTYHLRHPSPTVLSTSHEFLSTEVMIDTCSFRCEVNTYCDHLPLMFVFRLILKHDPRGWSPMQCWLGSCYWSRVSRIAKILTCLRLHHKPVLFVESACLMVP